MEASSVTDPAGRPVDVQSRRWTSGDLKQEILRIYNAVNQSISGVGVHRQRVDLLGDRILVVAEHKRIPALAALDPTRRELTRTVDIAIVDESKTRLSSELAAALGVRVRTVLKDYDPVTQLAATLVVLEETLTVD